MQFCQRHWDAIRAEVDRRGLTALVGDQEHAVAAMMGEGYDPLMASYLSIVSALASHDASVLFLEGCPLCFANDEHDQHCREPDCAKDGTHFDSWIGYAVNDQVTFLASQS